VNSPLGFVPPLLIERICTMQYYGVENTIAT
jgi:hypothetical protein